jgi:REP element-mobilizing transposase RayT
MKGIDRYWFLTSTTYGQWLPGDARGSVSRENVSEESHRKSQNEFGVPYSEGMAELTAASRKLMKADPIFLTALQADRLLIQFQETSDVRKWLLVGTAIMANHFHAIIGVPGDPDPDGLLRDVKAYGSGALNRTFGKPKSDTWWTKGGSKRKLANRTALSNAIQYLRDQEYPLLIWINPIVATWT